MIYIMNDMYIHNENIIDSKTAWGDIVKTSQAALNIDSIFISLKGILNLLLSYFYLPGALKM